MNTAKQPGLCKGYNNVKALNWLVGCLDPILGKSRSRDDKTELLFMEGTPIEIHQ